MSDRFLVMGDNHGDTESLRRVLDDTAGEGFDYVVHVGDFTRAMRHDDPDLGVRQLRESEPVLRDIGARAEHGLLWVYGDQEYTVDVPDELDVGTRIPDDGAVEVGGRRFTSDPERVDAETVLVTHTEHWRLADHFDGYAHFCGNSHFGRHYGRRLNSAFLQETDPETGEQHYGGYFVVEASDDGLDVECRSIGDLQRFECETHRERGVQFRPSDWPCLYDFDDRVLYRELAASAFYGVTREGQRESASVEDVVEHAVSLWDDPPEGFRERFEDYLEDVNDDRYAPLASEGDERLVVAENSYAY
jgi:predicted phosphodiesterase